MKHGYLAGSIVETPKGKATGTQSFMVKCLFKRLSCWGQQQHFVVSYRRRG